MFNVASQQVDIVLFALAHFLRRGVLELVRFGWQWPNVSFSLAAWASLLTSFPFVATLLGLVLAVRLIRMPEGEMRREGPPLRGAMIHLPTCETRYELLGRRESASSLVVMAHGFSGDCSHTRPLAEEVVRRTGHCVLIYDLVGRGYSSCKDHDHTIELFVSQLAELLCALELYQPAHFVGISLGGGVVTEYARYFPSKVASLTLIASVGLPLCSAAHVLTKIPLIPDFMFRCALWSSVVAGLEHEWADQTNPKLETLIQSYRDRVATEPALGRSLLSTARHFPFESLADSFEAVGAQAFPVLLVWGDEDRTCPVENAHTIRSTYIPRATLVEVCGARHCVYLEHAGQVAHALNRFFADLKSKIPEEQQELRELAKNLAVSRAGAPSPNHRRALTPRKRSLAAAAGGAGPSSFRRKGSSCLDSAPPLPSILWKHPVIRRVTPPSL
ncbi:hypothetical protein CTAYLR_007006 [Chrysophaeum taylorii]|uniref:AB hydrolase-1 domain-containing protein n=1 Tax=Chrysophaeum taylorii TaxID=2483200 RepID=A0AAD7XLX8_9STRA|nr:hypothetical protein CTAYLR_007006 [Chrysophaeum taylorii]